MASEPSPTPSFQPQHPPVLRLDYFGAHRRYDLWVAHINVIILACACLLVLLVALAVLVTVLRQPSGSERVHERRAPEHH